MEDVFAIFRTCFGNSLIFQLFPRVMSPMNGKAGTVSTIQLSLVTRFACDTGDLVLSSIRGHHHLSKYMDISRPADYFIACYTVLMRPNKVETAVHGCKCWLSVWTLSCRFPLGFYVVSALHHCLLLIFLPGLKFVM